MSVEDEINFDIITLYINNNGIITPLLHSFISNIEALYRIFRNSIILDVKFTHLFDRLKNYIIDKCYDAYDGKLSLSVFKEYPNSQEFMDFIAFIMSPYFNIYLFKRNINKRYTYYILLSLLSNRESIIESLVTFNPKQKVCFDYINYLHTKNISLSYRNISKYVEIGGNNYVEYILEYNRPYKKLIPTLYTKDKSAVEEVINDFKLLLLIKFYNLQRLILNHIIFSYILKKHK